MARTLTELPLERLIRILKANERLAGPRSASASAVRRAIDAKKVAQKKASGGPVDAA
jgi:hypothetical protein